MNSEDYFDDPPEIVVAKLADRGRYLCSASTMYRILRSKNLLTHRRRGKKREYGNRLETIATQPNQVWCWDISFLPTIIKGKYFKLYVIEDIFSRKIVGAKVANTDDVETAKDLVAQSLKAEGITGEGLRIHNDNGSPMKSYLFKDWLRSLGVIQTHSRPSVSDDNPFIEALFKTMKYTHLYQNLPFKNIEHATKWAESFTKWYNHEHMHSSINYVTPIEKHLGLDITKLKARTEVFKMAYEQNPLRWSSDPKNWKAVDRIQLNTAGCRITK